MNKKAPYHDFKKRTKNIRVDGLGDLLLNLKIIPNKSKDWNFYAKSMNNYLADHQELISEEQVEQNKQNRNLNAYGNYLSYMSRDSAKIESDINPTNHIWHYSNLKMYKGIETSTYKTIANHARLSLQPINNINKIHENSHIWSIVISEKDLNMKEIMYKNQHQIVDRILRAMFNFPVNATFAFHGNTEHPHMHIMVYQPRNMKNDHIQKHWKIPKYKLELAKKSYYYFLANNKNYFNNFLEEKHKLKTMYEGELLTRIFQKEFIDLLNCLSQDKEPWCDENGQQKLSKTGAPLYKMKFQYNRLNNEQKQQVLKIKDTILSINTYEQPINDFQAQYHKLHGIGDNLIEKEFDKLPDGKKQSLIQQLNKYYSEIDEKICQQILNTAKDFYSTNKNILKQSNDGFDEQNNNKNKSKVVTKPVINKLLLHNFGMSNYNNMSNAMKNQINLNENFSALKKLIRQMEYEYGNKRNF